VQQAGGVDADVVGERRERAAVDALEQRFDRGFDGGFDGVLGAVAGDAEGGTLAQDRDRAALGDGKILLGALADIAEALEQFRRVAGDGDFAGEEVQALGADQRMRPCSRRLRRPDSTSAFGGVGRL
jgi:hypothetical protein